MVVMPPTKEREGERLTIVKEDGFRGRDGEICGYFSNFYSLYVIEGGKVKGV